MGIVAARVEMESGLKEQAEQVLSAMGMTLSDAVNLFLRQVVLQQGIPVEIDYLPKENKATPEVSNLSKEAMAALAQKATRGEGATRTYTPDDTQMIADFIRKRRPIPKTLVDVSTLSDEAFDALLQKSAGDTQTRRVYTEDEARTIMQVLMSL